MVNAITHIHIIRAQEKEKENEKVVEKKDTYRKYILFFPRAFDESLARKINARLATFFVVD